MSQNPTEHDFPGSNMIVTAGDVIIDHHIYEGERLHPCLNEKRGVRALRQHGGAAVVHRLISALLKEKQKADAAEWGCAFGVTSPELNSEPCGHHALAVWRPFPVGKSEKEKGTLVWRASVLMGYGHDGPSPGEPAHLAGHCSKFTPSALPNVTTEPKILVLDDAGFVFRRSTVSSAGSVPGNPCWRLAEEGASPPAWIVLKMSSPVFVGGLWQVLSKRFADRLILVLSADHLREEFVEISRGLSWERTAQDLREALRNPALQDVVNNCRHLIVSFGADGALWLDSPKEVGKTVEATLVYDPSSIEGDWAEQTDGEAFGYLSCLASGLVMELVSDLKSPNLAKGIAAGLEAMRDLRKLGHGKLEDEESAKGFPAKRLAAKILHGGTFSQAPVPWNGDASSSRNWSILEQAQAAPGASSPPSLLGVARQVVINGQEAIRGFPHARFGDLATWDRTEIESLRNLRRLMKGYRLNHGAKRPLSIGVFGPPGAGKSFGVREIATDPTLFGPGAWIEFNLSNFKGSEDLIGALHQVRDKGLSGVVPVVFWDEFDAREYYWLQYLLAPMQDGRFQEEQITHPIGRCVFVFAGGTSASFAQFGPTRCEVLPDGTAVPMPQANLDYHTRLTKFTLAKGPDFLSRLDAYYDVLGPNQRALSNKGGPTDTFWPLRRALLLRHFLAHKSKATLDIDPGLLTALLEVPDYRHGARSLEKLALALKPSDITAPIRRSSLPAPAVLAMHVKFLKSADAASSPKDAAHRFTELAERDDPFRDRRIIETLAPAVHEHWRKLSKLQGWKMAEGLDHPFEELSYEKQEDNRAAAARIPSILALVGLRLEKKTSDSQATAKEAIEHIRHQQTLMAEAEHNGWWAFRLKWGWHYAEERDDKNRQHPALRAYAKLSDIDRAKDLDSVRQYSDMASRAGYVVVFSSQDQPSAASLDPGTRSLHLL